MAPNSTTLMLAFDMHLPPTKITETSDTGGGVFHDHRPASARAPPSVGTDALRNHSLGIVSARNAT